jgi:hypothetical protein
MLRFRLLNPRLWGLSVVVSAGALAVQGCAWKSDLDAAAGQVAAQTAQIESLTTELDTLRGQHDVLAKEKAKADASLKSLRDEYSGCVPVSERSGANDANGRFTATYRGGGSRHWYSVYDGVALYAEYECLVGDCATGYGLFRNPSAGEREAIRKTWRQVAAGKR